MKKNQCLAVLLFASALTVSAQTTYLWTNLVTGNGSGSWNTGANWLPAGPASGVGNTAQFTLALTNATTPGTVTLDSSPTIGNLFFGNTSASNLSWTVNAGTPATSVLNLSVSSGTPSISVTNRGVTFGAPMVSLQGFNLLGGGQLTLNNTNNFGTVSNSVAAGILDLNTLTALPAGTVVGVSSGASVEAPLAGTFASNNVTLTGGGASSEANPGALYFGGGGNATVTWPAPIALNGNATISSYGVTYNTTLGGIISGTGNLTLSARGGSASSHTAVFNLNNQSTYAGTSTFLNNAGLLSAKWVFGANNALPVATSLSVNNGNAATFSILDFAGFNQTLAALTMNGTATTANEYLTNSSATIPTLTLNTNAGTVFSVNEGTNNLNNLTLTVGNGGSGNATATTIGVGGATLLNVSNVTWNSSFYTDLGHSAAAVINLYQGTTLNNSGELLMGYGNGNATNTLNVNSGAVINAHYIRVGNNAPSTLNLNAGATVTADEIYSDYTTSCSFYFNGGLLQPHTAPLTPWFVASLTNVQVLAGGALINNGGDNLAVTASLLAGSPSGGLTALGSGTLALQGPNNTYTGSTVISNGTLAVDGNLFVSPVTNFAALAGTGYVAVATLNAGSQLYPGRSNVVGTLSISNLTTLGGSEMYFDLSSSDNSSTDGANDLLQLTNAAFGSQTLVGLNFYNGYPVNPNNYTVATYSGSVSGLANLALDPSLTGTRSAIGLDAIDYPRQIVVVVTNGTAPSSYLEWYGDNPNNNWDLATTENWTTSSDYFYNQDNVVFDDNAQISTVNLVGALYPATVNFNNNSLTYTLAGSGQIGGAVALSLNGTQPVIIDANNILNNTGGVILNGGNTLQIGNSDTAGAIGSSPVQFLNSQSTLNYNRTDSLTLVNRIYGSSSANPLVQVNSGTLTLGGTTDNSYATATVSSGGTLVLAKTSSSSVHALGGGIPGTTPALTINAGGTARLGGTGGDQIFNGQDVQSDGTFDLAGQNETINNLIGVNGTGVVTNSAAGAAVLSVGGANANVAYNGVFVNGTAGSLGLSSVGTGSVTLITNNTATGPLTLAGSAYVYLSNVTAQAWSGPVVFTNVGVAPRLEFLASQQLAPTSVISFSGTSERRVELNGFTETLGGLNDLSGVSGNVIVEPATDNTANEPGTLVLNVASGATYSTGGFIRNTAGAGTGSILTLIKTGAGTQIFSGVPGQVAYSGPTTVSNGVLEVSGAGSVLGNSAITLAGGTIDFAGGGTLGTNLSGVGLLQVGGGTLIVTNTPNFIGNTFISAGTLQLGSGTLVGSLASSFITNNGTLYITNGTASTITLTNNLTGSGTLTTLMSANGGQLVLSGNNSGWTGPISMLGNDAQTGGSGGWLVVANNTALGSPASRTITLPAANPAGAMGIELMGNVSVGTNQTIAIGGRQISGVIYGTNACLQNVSGNNNWAGTLNINNSGGLYALNCLSGQLELSGSIENTVAGGTRGFQLLGAGNYLLDGAITNGSSTALTQIQFSGTGVSVVSGTNNNYSGPTTISSGTVLVTGVVPTNTVTVATNATLGGSGLILGATTIQGGGILAPGTASIGTLTISNTLVLSANSTNMFRLNAATTNNDAVAGLSTVTYGGMLIVTNINGTLAAGESFKLFNATTINSTPFASVQLPTLTGNLAWTNSLTANGAIAVVSTFTVATNRVPITYTVGGGGSTLNLSWPPDHLGWRLLAQTNALATGLSNNWTTVTGSTTETNLSVPINQTNGSVFFQLVYP